MVAGLIKTIYNNRKSEKLGDLTAINNGLRKYHLISLENFSNKKLIDKINKILNGAGSKEYKNSQFFKILSKEISNPKYRAHQVVYRYRQLHIFKSFSKVIDLAILSFLRGNFAACYLTLMQVVQEVLRKWLISLNEDENPQIILDKLKEKIIFTKEELDELKNHQENEEKPKKLTIKKAITTKEGECYNRLKYLTGLYKYLSLMIKDIFQNDNLSSNILTNRYIKNHFSKKPGYFCNPINTLALLLLLDVIAELYLWKNQYDYLMLTSSLDSKFDHRLYKRYQKFYSSHFKKSPKSKNPEELLLERFYQI